MHTGRSRHRSHAGIPQGSTNNLGSTLAFYLQHNTGQIAHDSDANACTKWEDQSGNNNFALQATAGDCAGFAEGGLDFTSSEADHYDFQADFAIATQHCFVVFFVIKLETTSANTTLLGMGTASHFLELKGGGDTARIKLHNSLTEISPGDGDNDDFPSDELLLVTVQREAGSTGNLNIWKNGILLAQDSQVANTGDAEFNTLGIRSGDRYLNGIVYDAAVIDSGASDTTDSTIDRMNAYFTSKHGIL